MLERNGNPLVVIPTAGGKTVVFATLIRRWLEAWPRTRVCILAHVMELLEQAEAKLKAVWPAAPVGVWSAGLGRKEGNRSITIAGIQSIYKRAFDFDPFDVLIVDEAHLIPVGGEGMYRRFLKDCRLAAPHVRVVGFTATPFRLDGGHIARDDYVLQAVAYEARIRELIDQGYLCDLRSKATASTLDVDGVKVRQGDYVASELERRVNTDTAVEAAADEIVAKGADRRSWLIFCCGVGHAHHVADALHRRGIESAVITGDTPADDRARTLAAFDAGRLRAVVNVNCLTTGLDVTRIDLIALLRPTCSTSLYVQMVGRGFRLHPSKKDCLVLDFGGNVRRHGPVDAVDVARADGRGDPGSGEAPTKVCPECQEIVHAAVRQCIACGHEFPEPEIKHNTKADAAPILSSDEPWDVEVEGIEVTLHRKEGKPASLQVTYVGNEGLDRHRQWICLEHGGIAGQKAGHWWRRRFGDPVPATASEAMESNLFLADALKEMTRSIQVRRVGKYTEIVNVSLQGKEAYGAVAR